MTARSDPPEASSNQPRRYFAFLRAINVGGRRLTNDELLAPFVGLGLREVAAYQAAGNITFVSDEPDTVRPDRLEAAAGEAYGFRSSVFVRSHAELSAIGRPGPFSAHEMAGTEGRVQVAFLQITPDASTVAEALALVPAGERVVFRDRAWCWLPVRGISDSQLPVRAIEDLVGPTTIRTLGTVERMLDKFG